MTIKDLNWQDFWEGRKPLTEAVKALRLSLGDTQQQFAYRLGLAISTVIRYETNRPPRGRALAQMKATAESAELSTLTAIFRHALAKELELPISELDGSQKTLPAGEVRVTPKNLEEETLTRALLKFLRSDRTRPGWKKRRRQIGSLLQAYVPSVASDADRKEVSK